MVYQYGKPIQPRHKVFVSFHHAKDQAYRDRFEYLFVYVNDVMVSKSVQIGDIDPNLKTETLRQKIRDEYLRDSTVTVVLIGAETWQRKHVDWEISASIRKTQSSSRSGLLGIILPNYLRFSNGSYDPYTIPPRLWKNIECKYAKMYGWSDDPQAVRSWIHEAFLRRQTTNPHNAFPLFVNNRSGSRWQE